MQNDNTNKQSSRLAGMIFLLGALILTVWMAVPALQNQGIVGCGVECSEVLSSKWAAAFKLPVSVFGGLLYLATIFAVAFRNRSLSRLFITGIFAAALYFAFLQAFIIRAFCPWCCATHFVACLGGIFALRSLTIEKSVFFSEKIKVLKWSHAIAVSGAALAMLYGIQKYGPEKTGSITVAQKQNINLTLSSAGDLVVYGKHIISPGAFPVIARQSAGQGLISEQSASSNLTRTAGTAIPALSSAPILFLHDWTCSHCRQLHHDLLDAKSINQILLIPASREEEGKAIHKLMITAWVVNPPLYESTAAAIHSGTLPATHDAVAQALASIHPSDEQAAQVNKLLALGDAILAENDSRLSVSTLPQLLSAYELLTGSPSADALAAFISASQGELITQSVANIASHTDLPVNAAQDDAKKSLFRTLFLARDADPLTFSTLAAQMSAGTLPTVSEVKEKLTASLNAERLVLIERNLGKNADALVTSLSAEQLHSNDAAAVLSTLQTLRVPTLVRKTAAKSQAANANISRLAPATTAQLTTVTPPAASALAWENTTLPKSQVVSGQALKQSARFTNNLKTPVTISNIRPSCGCTVAQGANQTVEPGKTGEITIQINTAGQPVGDLAKGVTVVTIEDGKPCNTFISIPYTITAADSAAPPATAATSH